jgi:PAS domain S-box-containing protein
LAYYLAARFGLRLVMGKEWTPLVWLPAGLLLGALLHTGPRQWGKLLAVVFVADVLAHYHSGRGEWASLAAALAHSGEGILGAALLRRVLADRFTLDRLPGVLALMLLPGLTSTALGATLGAALDVATGAKAGFWPHWLVRWGATTVGIVIMTPLVLTAPGMRAWLRRTSPGRVAEGAVLLLFAAGSSLIIFQVEGPEDAVVVPSLMLPFLEFIWAGLRFGARGVAGVYVVLGPLAVWHTAHGLGAMSVVGNTPLEVALLMQLYLAVAGLPSLVFAASLAERRALLEALQAEEERFRQLAENIRDVFWLMEWPGKRVLYASPAFETIWGLPCARLYDDPFAWSRAIPEAERQRVEQTFVEAAGERNWEAEYQIVRPDGAVRWIRDQGYPIRNTNGEVYRVAGIAEDITERKRAEQVRLGLEARLLQAQKLEAVGQLAGGVAHDFNNLLTIIMGHASLLQQPSGSAEDRRASSAEILAASDRAVNLTRQLLAFSRRQVMQPRPLDLNEVVSSITRMLQRLIGEHIALQAEFAPGGAMIQADPGMMEQVIMNLAVNARDAMPKGGRLGICTTVLEVDPASLRVPPRVKPGSYVRLTLSDTGSGIPPDQLPHIFEPFFTTKDVGKGTGLGLATVFGIVDQHNGWIDVESQVGLGTSFHVFIPHLTDIVPAPATPAAEPPAGRGTETVLLVEDEAPVRALARRMLEQRGYRVHEAADGRQALEVWAAHGEAIDLLLTDLVMPGGLTGYELAERLRARQPDLKVLCASGYSEEILGKVSIAGLRFNFLPKPYDEVKLARAVRDCLDAD